MKKSTGYLAQKDEQEFTLKRKRYQTKERTRAKECSHTRTEGAWGRWEESSVDGARGTGKGVLKVTLGHLVLATII